MWKIGIKIDFFKQRPINFVFDMNENIGFIISNYNV
jgi:hypothetical protein